MVSRFPLLTASRPLWILTCVTTHFPQFSLRTESGDELRRSHVQTRARGSVRPQHVRQRRQPTPQRPRRILLHGALGLPRGRTQRPGADLLPAKHDLGSAAVLCSRNDCEHVPAKCVRSQHEEQRQLSRQPARRRFRTSQR